MNGTSGFQEVRSSISRSPGFRFVHEQQPQFGTGAWSLLHTHNLIARSTSISTKLEKVPDIFSNSRLPWGICLLFTIHAVMASVSAFAADTAVTLNASSAHSTELNVHPAPLPKVPLTLNRQALGPNIRMWFPAYDGDGFFASLDQTKQLSEESFGGESVFKTSIAPILQSLGFATDLQSHFFVPRHSGSPSGRANFSKLAPLVCRQQHLDSEPQTLAPADSRLPTVGGLDMAHSAPARITGTMKKASDVGIDYQRAFQRSQKEWANWWCQIFERVGEKDALAILESTRSPFAKSLDQVFQDRNDQTFSQFVRDFERQEYVYFFTQVHTPSQKEFAANLTPPKAVTIDHAGIRADRREGQGIYSATGRVFVCNQVATTCYKVANRVTLSAGQAAKATVTELKKLDGITNAEAIPLEAVSLVLLPSGEAQAENTVVPALRYAYRMPAYIFLGAEKRLLYLWFDAEEGKFLEIVPLFSHAAQAVGNTLHQDPGGVNGTTTFKIDEPTIPLNSPPTDVTLTVGGELTGQYLSNGNTIPFSISNQPVPAALDSPWNFAASVLITPPTSDIENWEKIDLFATVYRYLDTLKQVGFTWNAGQPITIHIGGSECDLGALSVFNSQFMEFHPYVPAACSKTGPTWKSYNDHTLVSHELGHIVTKRQYGYYPNNPNFRSSTWCDQPHSPEPAPTPCPLPIDPEYVHDFADAWVQVFEDTNCVGGWMGQGIFPWQVGTSFSPDDSLHCTKHHEGSGWPRRASVPDPNGFSYDFSAWPATNSFDISFATTIGDHFPEHRKVSHSQYGDMQIAAAALWEVRQGAMSLSYSGPFLYLTRFVQTLATTGWLALNNQNGYTDKDVYRGLIDLEIKLANQWRSESIIDRSVNKVAAGFARAGIFMIHPACLDNDHWNNQPCPDGSNSGGDAVIDVTDNAPGDDSTTVDTIVHQDRDWLRPGSPAPGFHVWTGPRYVFVGEDASFGSGTPPMCNNAFKIDLAEDGAFTTILATSDWKWKEVNAAKPCYYKWDLDISLWQNITDQLMADQKNRIYYRVVTCTVTSKIPCLYDPEVSLRMATGNIRGEMIFGHSGRNIFSDFSGTAAGENGMFVNPDAKNVRYSTKPANNLFGRVQPPYAIVNKWGTFPPFPLSTTLGLSYESLKALLPERLPPIPPLPPVLEPRITWMPERLSVP